MTNDTTGHDTPDRLRHILRRGSAAVFFVFALTVPALRGSAAAQEPEAVCDSESEFHAFDFWIGEWTVFDNSNGKVAGHNRIESGESGCVVLEHWTSSTGGTGMSMNYFDNVTGKWRQVWVAANYSIDIVGGLNAEGAMVLEGQLHNYRQRRAFDFRGTWTPAADGSVRQLFEQKDDSGEWQVWFDGRYVRDKDGG